MKPHRSLQARVLAAALAGSAALWCVVAALTWADARHELGELLDAHLAQAAALLVAQQLPELEEASRADAPVLHRYAPRVAFQVFHEGRLALRSANAPLQPMADPAQGDGFRDVVAGGEDWRVFATRGAARDVQVFVGERVSSRASILRAVLRSFLWPIAIALPLLALALWAGVRGGLAPLRRLGAVLAARRPEDLQPVGIGPVPREMQPLLGALDALFARIAALLDAERRFTADAAHELRTPIAAIRAQAQVALEAAGEAQRRHALEATLQGCDRAARLVDQLLTLARLEADGGLSPADIDLAGVARGVLAEAAPGAIAHGKEVSLSGHATVRGDPALLAILVRNLVDNAIRHAPASGRIEVRVEQGPGGAALVVEDSGPGLGDADLARLGERFFRVAGTSSPGSGLGLSIAARIAAAHGARLRFARSQRLGGLQATMELPAAAPSA